MHFGCSPRPWLERAHPYAAETPSRARTLETWPGHSVAKSNKLLRLHVHNGLHMVTDAFVLMFEVEKIIVALSESLW